MQVFIYLVRGHTWSRALYMLVSRHSIYWSGKLKSSFSSKLQQQGGRRENL